MTWFYYLVVAGFGLIFGSFFNVCVYRMPEGESLGQRSHCTSCGSTIRWYDNIPLLSFVLLKGRCRNCGSGISWRYPLVELSTAVLFVLVYWWSGNTVPVELGVARAKVIPELFIGLLMVSVIVISTGVDLTQGIIPNKATYPGIILMFLMVTGFAVYRGEPGRIWQSVAGGAIGGGFLLTAGLVYGALFMRRERAAGGEAEGGSEETKAGRENDESGVPTGIGIGDVKLMLIIGLALGYFHWYLIFFGLFLGFMIGALFSVFLLIFAGKKRKDRIPFAPFLSAGAIIALLWSRQIVDLYLKLLR